MGVADAGKREKLKSDAAVFVFLSTGPLADKDGGGYWSNFGFQFSCLPLLNGSSCGLFIPHTNNLKRGAAEKSDVLTSLSSALGGKVQTRGISLLG